MQVKTKKADISCQKSTAKKQNLIQPAVYQNLPQEQRKKVIECIARRWGDMPKVYRANYDKAVSGKSLRAAVNSFCIHCVMYQREEVRLCTALSCPLWPYRPYQGILKKTSEGRDSEPESKNSGLRV